MARFPTPRPAIAAAGEQRRQHIEAVTAHYRQLEVWAANCPENFENRAALVGAEIARIDGRDVEAMRLYEKAIRSARANGFVHNEALAYELAARFYAARGFETIAQAYVRTPGTATSVGEPMARSGNSMSCTRTSARESRRRRCRRPRSGHRSNTWISPPSSKSRRPCRARSSSRN